jgi:hypothetical protein
MAVIPPATFAYPPQPPRFRRGGADLQQQATDALSAASAFLHNDKGITLSEGNSTGVGVRVAIFDNWPMYPIGCPAIEEKPAAEAPKKKPVDEAALTKINDFVSAVDETSINTNHIQNAAGGALVLSDHVFNYVDLEPANAPLNSRRDCDGNELRSYDQADHGLFIAGIVKDIAPDADLYIYRVLGSRTCEDFDTLVEAMGDAVDLLTAEDNEQKDNPIIFNFSLGWAPQLLAIRLLLDNLELAYIYGQRYLDALLSKRLAQVERVTERIVGGRPTSEQVTRAKAAELQRDRLVNAAIQLAGGREFVRQYGINELGTTEELLRILRRRNILIVAAAGNDNCPGSAQQPDPRIPAWFESVLGVSAVTDLTGTPASYSNLDDVSGTPDDGISAIGGDVLNDISTSGLYGLHTSPVLFTASDEEVANTTGIARWSGTSFATPVVTGFAACLWSKVLGASASDILDAIVTDPITKNPRGVIPLEQGGWE